MLDWWDFQKGWRVRCELFFSELIFPSGFLPWGAVTLRLIGRIACMMEGGAPIGRALSSSVYWDGMTDPDILKGARQAYPVKCAQNNVTLLFFPDFSRLQRSGERHLVRFWRRWQHLVSSPSSSIQRWLSYGTKENRRSFDSPQKAEGFISSMSQQKSYAAALRGDDGGSSGRCFSGSTRRAWSAWMDLALAAQKGMIAGWPWMLAKPIFCVFFSYTGILSLIYPVQRSLCW